MITCEEEAIRCVESRSRGCKRYDFIAFVFYFRTVIVS